MNFQVPNQQSNVTSSASAGSASKKRPFEQVQDNKQDNSENLENKPKVAKHEKVCGFCKTAEPLASFGRKSVINPNNLAEWYIPYADHLGQDSSKITCGRICNVCYMQCLTWRHEQKDEALISNRGQKKRFSKSSFPKDEQEFMENFIKEIINKGITVSDIHYHEAIVAFARRFGTYKNYRNFRYFFDKVRDQLLNPSTTHSDDEEEDAAGTDEVDLNIEEENTEPTSETKEEKLLLQDWIKLRGIKVSLDVITQFARYNGKPIQDSKQMTPIEYLCTTPVTLSELNNLLLCFR